MSDPTATSEQSRPDAIDFIADGDPFGWKLKNARLIVVGRREWQS